jgi:hypothetical protein
MPFHVFVRIQVLRRGAIMRSNRPPDTRPFPPDHPTFRELVNGLAAMPWREVLAFIGLFERWRTSPRDRRAMLAKTVWTNADDWPQLPKEA